MPIAPALVLLNPAGQLVWKRDIGLSDEAPQDLEEGEIQMETLARDP